MHFSCWISDWNLESIEDFISIYQRVIIQHTAVSIVHRIWSKVGCFHFFLRLCVERLCVITDSGYWRSRTYGEQRRLNPIPQFIF